MPQVSARISRENERWLKEWFPSKSAGAEFLLPWAARAFTVALADVRERFSKAELLAIIEACRGARLSPDTASAACVAPRLKDACERARIDERYPVSVDSLCGRLARLDDTQAAALMAWACAFWRAREAGAISMEEYAAGGR